MKFKETFAVTVLIADTDDRIGRLVSHGFRYLLEF